jgi:rhodanese-related sulfurtransferase
MTAMDDTQIPEIDINEAKRRVEGGSLFLDVREQDEYTQARIAGTTLLPLSRFAAEFEATLPKDREIVIHCRSGQRSANATAFLNERGYTAVNVAGGIIAWAGAELPIERG